MPPAGGADRANLVVYSLPSRSDFELHKPDWEDMGTRGPALADWISEFGDPYGLFQPTVSKSIMNHNMLRIGVGSTISLALLACLPVSAAELVYNGGFELPGVPVGSLLSVPSGSTVGGWQVQGGSGSIYVGRVGSGWPGPFEGTDYLYLNNDGVDGVSITQSITLDAATTYHLSFAMSGVIVGNNIAREPAVMVQVGSATASFDGTAGNIWQTFGFDFTTIGGGPTLLKFSADAALTKDHFAVDMLDAISVQAVSAVPEPSSYALMIGGLAGLLGLRKRLVN